MGRLCYRVGGPLPRSPHWTHRGGVLWNDALAKWRRRCVEIGRSGAPASAAAELYRNRALPTLGYIAQFAPLPKGIEKEEARLVGRMLHLPGNAIGQRWHLDLPQWGGTSFGSVRVYSAGARLRAALTTMRGWQEVAMLLRSRHADSATLFEVGSGIFWPSWWDSRPYVAHLDEALRACAGDGDCHRALLPHFESVYDDEKPQSRAVAVMTAGLAPDAVVPAAVRRLGALGLEGPPATRGATLRETLGILRGVSPHYAMLYINTILNAWPTMARVHSATGGGALRLGMRGTGRHVAALLVFVRGVGRGRVPVEGSALCGPRRPPRSAREPRPQNPEACRPLCGGGGLPTGPGRSHFPRPRRSDRSRRRSSAHAFRARSPRFHPSG